MKGPAGYGRYDDDPNCVGCPRAQSDMTPCVARDGRLACAGDGLCVGCGADPRRLLNDLHLEIDRVLILGSDEDPAERLRDLVLEVTEPKERL